MKASTLLQAFLLSALVLGLSQAYHLHGGCCNTCGSSPCGCVAPQPAVLPVPVPVPVPSCGCPSPCGGGCSLPVPVPVPVPSCGCPSPCGGGCGLPAPLPVPSCGCPSPCGGGCGPRHGHHGLHGLHGLRKPLGLHPPCGRLLEVTKTKKFLVPPPKPVCHKCLVPVCVCQQPAPPCGC